MPGGEGPSRREGYEIGKGQFSLSNHFKSIFMQIYVLSQNMRLSQILLNNSDIISSL